MNQNAPSQGSLTNSPNPTAGNTAANQRKLLIGIILSVVIVLGLVIAAVYFLATTDPGNTSRIRDIFIIFMALESLIIGVALIILILQLATLINLIQNELKPILNSTNETVNTLRGTTTFISNNLVEPVIKLNEYLAAIKRLMDLVRIPRL
jgi:heme/copper-type cytochrome/quinol oxidase subunit 2